MKTRKFSWPFVGAAVGGLVLGVAVTVIALALIRPAAAIITPTPEPKPTPTVTPTPEETPAPAPTPTASSTPIPDNPGKVGEWVELTQVPLTARVDAHIIWLGDSYLVFGGVESIGPEHEDGMLREAARYYPETSTWERVPDLPGPAFEYFSSTIVGDTTWIGVQTDPYDYTEAFYLFHTSDNTWTVEQPAFEGDPMSVNVLASDGTIIIDESACGHAMRTVGASTWTELPDPPTYGWEGACQGGFIVDEDGESNYVLEVMPEPDPDATQDWYLLDLDGNPSWTRVEQNGPFLWTFNEASDGSTVFTAYLTTNQDEQVPMVWRGYLETSADISMVAARASNLTEGTPSGPVVSVADNSPDNAPFLVGLEDNKVMAIDYGDRGYLILGSNTFMNSDQDKYYLYTFR